MDHIDRWILNWQQLWMIAMKSSGDFSWPWSNCESEDEAEAIFAKEYPAVHGFMKQHEQRLRARSDQGKFWWELRSCAYWDTFGEPKILYQLIQYHPQFAFDSEGTLGNNKTSFIASADRFLLASLNSPLMWWFNWRYLQHMKDEALAPNPTEMVDLPIAVPSEETRVEVDTNTGRIIEIHHSRRDTVATLLDWLRVEFDIGKPNRKLQAPLDLDSDGLVSEVRKVRGRRNPLSAAGLRALRDEYDRTIEPAKALAREALTLEHRLSDLVNDAYGLTPEEIDLMWKTAPPRMPIPRLES